jgi:hypothetical protein
MTEHRTSPNSGDNGSVILFLDVDGVLNSKASREIPKGEVTVFDDSPDPQMLAHLALIVQKTCAYLVVSSSWKSEEETLERLRLTLNDVGLEYMDVTPDLETCCRGDRVDEILSWLEQYQSRNQRKVLAWLAIDDIDLLRLNDRMDAAHFVRTDDAVGLTESKVHEALQKFRDQGASLIDDI